MWPRQLFLTGAVLAVLATPATAQTPADPVVDELQTKFDRFLELVSSGSIQTAYEVLLAGGQLGSRSKESKARSDLIAETEKIGQRYGTYRAFEPVYSKRVGKDLVFLKYLYKCSDFPILWHVTFYRAPSGSETATDSGGTWQVIAVRFDTNLEVLTLLKE